MIIPSGRRALPAALGVAAAVFGVLVALHYHRLGLTLSHYDARGHLIVARRIFDSITPGWQQIGAVWLPLPHLLNAIPVQVDAWYRSGASAVVMSVAAYAVAVMAIARLIHAITASDLSAVAGAAVFALNPNVLYLQSTPMTEPLLLALITLALALLVEKKPAAGLFLALACWTRYEAWPVTGAAILMFAWVRWRQGAAFPTAAREAGRVALFPAIAVAGFMLLSRATVGEWLTTSGFFVPENKALGDPLLAATQVWEGVRDLSGPILMTLAVAGMGTILVMGVSVPERAHLMLPLALAATAALPWVAFLDGHPFRIRYGVSLIAMQAVAVGACTVLFRQWRWAGALLVLGVVAYEIGPLDPRAPMVVEAQWDQPNRPVRERVTACLQSRQPGDKIMASMGSLGHYMQDASHAGLNVRDFLHEGNGNIWLAALDRPRPFAAWLLIEETAEGGDMLALRARGAPQFLEGYSRVCEGAGLALYRRD